MCEVVEDDCSVESDDFSESDELSSPIESSSSSSPFILASASLLRSSINFEAFKLKKLRIKILKYCIWLWIVSVGYFEKMVLY
jgi:hypothetical protein